MINLIRKNINIYIISIGLLVITAITSFSTRILIDINYENYIEKYNDIRWTFVYSNIKSAIKISKLDLRNRGNNISYNINNNLDKDQVLSMIRDNIYYPDLYILLKNNLQNNIFTSTEYVDKNRNNIFVLSNGKMIANFGNIKNYRTRLSPDGTNFLISNDIKTDIIDKNFFNRVLSLNAIRKIESQSDDIIIWQSRKPKYSDLPVYGDIGEKELKNIFFKYGIDGLESFEILVPFYITEYGNVFGETVVSNDDNITDKIIIVQKINLKDYFTTFNPINNDILSSRQLDTLEENYTNMNNIILLFEIVLYICILIFIYMICTNINNLYDITTT